jgi:hypothetical protein
MSSLSIQCRTVVGYVGVSLSLKGQDTDITPRHDFENYKQGTIMKTRKTLPRAIREQIVAGEVIDGARWPITGFWCPLCGWPAHPVLQSDNYAHPCCLSKESN